MIRTLVGQQCNGWQKCFEIIQTRFDLYVRRHDTAIDATSQASSVPLPMVRPVEEPQRGITGFSGPDQRRE
jgi:hypothetical protein